MQGPQGRLASIFQISRTNKLIALGVTIAVVLAGYALLRIHAAGFFAASEAEQSTLSGNAQLISDASASGGSAVKFNSPAPTPSPTPPPPPPFGNSTCPLPKYPSPSCTGVRAGTTFVRTVNGEYDATTNGEIIDSWHITGDLVVKASNVVIKNTQIDGHVDNETAPTSSFTISDSTVGPASCDTQGWPSINGHDFTANRVYLRGHQDGIDMVANSVTVNDSFVQPCYQPPSVVGGDGFHSDGVQDQCSTACTGLVLTHNTFDSRAFYNGQPTGNSALNLGSQPDGLHMRGVTLMANLFLGGSFTTDLHWDAGGNWVVSGNSWVQGTSAYGPITTESTCSNQTWSAYTDATITPALTIPNRIVIIDGSYNVTSVVNTTGCID